MRKVCIILTIFLCALIVSFSLFNTKTQKVLVVGELTAFEVPNYVESTNSTGFIRTSLKKLGVITYINPETNQFAALGHSLTNSGEETEIEGICYGVKFSNNRGSTNSLQNVYLNQNEQIGEVYYDSYSGVYGKVDDITYKNYKEVETTSRYEVEKGEAEILINVDGKVVRSYKVEIVGINHLAKSKNIRVKITDERLLNKTGGIVQGMSGTPLMQNGKLLGAINCVNASDSTDAFAIFIDKLL